jgi:eukaryotic-like serine/threonine-protein kinase
MIGQTIGGRYQIIHEIGRGGFGITYLANDKGRPGNPQCVVKQFKPIVNDPINLEVGKILFEREAGKLEKLGEHNQIPRLLGYFEEQQEFFLIQEYIEGNDLNQEISPAKKTNETYILNLLHDILEILAVVHQQNLIHRDLKPSNILRRQSDRKIILIDFGAVKEVSTQVVSPEGNTSYTKYIHTPGYAPSEQLKGQANFCSDVYAVGVICIHAITGMNPSPNGLPTNVKTGEIEWRERLTSRKLRANIKISPKLANVIDKMVYDGTKRSQRYQNASVALEAVKGILPQSKPWKLWLSIGLAAAIMPIIIWTGNQIATKITKQNFLPYENNTNAIKIKHPENWQPKTTNDNFAGEVIQFLPKQQNSANSCPLELTISVSELPQILSLNEYKNTVLEKIKNNNSNSQITDKSQPSTILSGLGAYKLVYLRQREQCQLQVMEIGTVKNGKAYYVTYTAEIKEYSQNLSAAEEMINSFQIGESN